MIIHCFRAFRCTRCSTYHPIRIDIPSHKCIDQNHHDQKLTFATRWPRYSRHLRTGTSFVCISSWYQPMLLLGETSSEQHNCFWHRGTFPCGRSQCNTCTHTNASPRINKPGGYITINSKYSFISYNVLYAIKCHTCNKIYIGQTGRRLADHFREHLLSTLQTNTDLPVDRHFTSPRHACTDMLVSVIRSWLPKTGAASKPGWSSNTKHYIQQDLIPTLPSYKHPKSMRASHIEIVLDLNVHTHFSLRAQFTVAFYHW